MFCCLLSRNPDRSPAYLSAAGKEKYHKIKKGCCNHETDAKKRLIEIYLPQVIEISKLYTGQGVYIEDLVGEGNLALAQGVTMLGCLEHAKEAEGMLMKMVMDAMEELIQEDLTEKDIVKKAIDQEKKKKNNNDSLQTDTDTGEDSAK